MLGLGSRVFGLGLEVLVYQGYTGGGEVASTLNAPKELGFHPKLYTPRPIS